ncbi:MAG: TRAP transporter small permease subunit [Sulfolobales archaeon]|nr:TRAP transporter small permease subunit [Sulfolobales archaeon]MDW8083059.1 TRAP transporter small permease subunit [Sulfolobales archaeon]
MDPVSRFNTILAHVVKYSTMFLVVTVVYGVVVRYVFRAADARAFFLSVWLYGTLFVLGGAYTLLEGGHVSVDVLFNKLPKRVRYIFELIGLAVVAIGSAILVWVGAPVAWRSFTIWEVDSSLGIVFAPPIWWYKWIAVVGSALVFLQALVLIVKIVRRGV